MVATAKRGDRSRQGTKAAQKALPLKFFNVKSSERFVFKRRDRRCLTLSPRSSLIPVFIHFSDMFPELVQATLSKCKSLISSCSRVVLVRPNHERVHSDDVVWEGPGSSIPHRCWDRHATVLRTLDIVQYKVSAHDRKRELLTIEQELWNVVEPFLCRINGFAQFLITDSTALDELSSCDAVMAALKEDKPWCITVDAIVSQSSPSLGDREHVLHYSPRAGVFVREFIDADEGYGIAGTSIPLVTLPCRLQSDMTVHPPLPQLLQFLSSILPRVAAPSLRDAISILSAQFPVEPTSPGTPRSPELESQVLAQKRYLEGVLQASTGGSGQKRQRSASSSAGEGERRAKHANVKALEEEGPAPVWLDWRRRLSSCASTSTSLDADMPNITI
mmetsp:Transcript_60779/g.143396  ORF Transcript_60779/g.143396 Transcript_60779/m.143396 type:complete len:389 (+) Transcript_60779:197-1363(+)